MLVKVEDIPEQGLKLDEPLAADFLDESLPPTQELHATGPVSVELLLQKDGDRVSLNGRAAVAIEGACAFCLKPLHLPLKARIGVILFRAPDTGRDQKNAPEAEEDDGESAVEEPADIGMGSYDGKVVNWGELVREQLLLTLPIAPRCKEDCLGLCPTCGVDRNQTTCDCAEKTIDPRWEKLKLLKLEN